MSEILQQVLYMTASYIGIVVILLYSLNWMSKGWLWSFLKVKSSKGKKVLVSIVSKTDVYYRTGNFEGDVFHYTTRNKDKKILTNISRDDLFQTMGVFCIQTDESSDAVFKIDGNIVCASDGQITDDFLTRAIMAPSIDDNWKKFVVISLIVVFLGIVIVGFIAWDIRSIVLVTQQITGVIR